MYNEKVQHRIKLIENTIEQIFMKIRQNIEFIVKMIAYKKITFYINSQFFRRKIDSFSQYTAAFLGVTSLAWTLKKTYKPLEAAVIFLSADSKCQEIEAWESSRAVESCWKHFYIDTSGERM